MNRLNSCCLSGDVWHTQLEGLPTSGVLYGYKVEGAGGWETGYRWDASRILLDPYAPLVAGRKRWAQRDEFEEFTMNVSVLSAVHGHFVAHKMSCTRLTHSAVLLNVAPNTSCRS